MTEQDRAGKNKEQNELTSRPNSSNLEREGEIFMADGTNGSPEQPHGPEEPKREGTESSATPPEVTPSEVRKRKPRARRQPQSGSSQEPISQASEASDVPKANVGDASTSGSPDSSSETQELANRIIGNAIVREVQAKEYADLIKAGIGSPEVKKMMAEAGIKDFDQEKLVDDLFDWEERKREVARNIAERRKEKEYIYVPQSLEELAQLVMHRATPEYRKDGDKCLINYKKDENGHDTKEIDSVNTVHFLDWARNNYFLVHLNNPTAPVNFFSDIATNVKSEGIGSTISFYEMSFTDSYYLKEVRDEQGKVTGQVENEEYKALKTQMLMEVFLLQLQRNPAVSYVLQSRSEREKMLNALAEAFVTNPLTRSNFMETIFSQPSMHGKSIYDLDQSVIDKGELEKKIEGNFLMGDATREALAAYINIYSYEQLVKIFGSDSSLFKYTYEKWNALSGKPGEGSNETAADVTDTEHPDKRKNEWFYTKEDVKRLAIEGITIKEGDLKLYALDEKKKPIPVKDQNDQQLKDNEGNPIFKLFNKIDKPKKEKEGPHPEFMKYVNIFLTPSPDQRQQDEIRERIRLSIMERNGISYREAQIAELMAYSMTHIYGIAARNDTDSVAFDWWTRPQNFLDKRKREKSPTRNAPYGSKFNMEGFKRIGLNIFEGVRDVRRRSLRDIIQGGTGTKIDIKGNPLKNNVDYEKDKNGLIIFVDPKTGERITGVQAKTHEVLHENRTEGGKEIIETKVIFKDGSGQVVDTGEYKPKKAEKKKVKDPIEFKQAIQQGFLVNHLVAGSKIYEWIMYKKELALPEITTDYDAHGNPIVNWTKINEIKGGIEHDFRYLFSTWGEINYAERNVEWEMIEVRDEKGMLINKDNESEALDEDWYVLDAKGNRIDRRADPKTYLATREMSRLENMFGKDALEFIQAEIVKQKLNKKTEIIPVTDERTKEQLWVDISAASSEDEPTRRKFALAVWQGAFDYLVASEILAHRTRGSGDAYYDAETLKKAFDALRVGQILEPDQIKNIRKETNTGTRKIYGQDFGYAFATGGVAGVWKVFEIMFKDILSGK